MNAAVLLRQKVLDLAIRGKLTKREKDDEPASALLARVVAEKEKRNAKVGRVRTSAVPQPIPDDEKPFTVPKGWEWSRLGTLCEIVSKGTTPTGGKNGYASTGVNFIRAESIGVDGFINLKDIRFISESVHVGRLRRSKLSEGDVLITIAGTLGRTGVVRKIDLPANTNQAVCFIRLLRRSDIDEKYIRFVLSAPTLQEILLGQKKVTGVPNLTLETIANAPIPLPSLAEQKRIVERIDELLAAIDKYSAAMGKIANAANLMEQKVLDLAIRGKLTNREKGDEPTAALLARIAAERQKRNSASCRVRVRGALPPVSDDEKRFELPEGWEWCRLGEFGEVVLGKMLNRNVQTGKESEYLCTINVKWGSFDLTGWLIDGPCRL